MYHESMNGKGMYHEAIGWGFKPSTARVLQRLLDYLNGNLRDGDSSTIWIVERFKKLHVLDEDGRLPMENPESAIEWILIGLIWEGYARKAS